MTTLSDILRTTSLEQIATGFRFTEGPLWHPDGFFYFVDLFSNLLYRMTLGQKPEKVRDILERFPIMLRLGWFLAIEIWRCAMGIPKDLSVGASA